MSEAIPINSDDEDGDTNPNVGKRQPKQKKFVRQQQSTLNGDTPQMRNKIRESIDMKAKRTKFAENSTVHRTNAKVKSRIIASNRTLQAHSPTYANKLNKSNTSEPIHFRTTLTTQKSMNSILNKNQAGKENNRLNNNQHQMKRDGPKGRLPPNLKPDLSKFIKNLVQKFDAERHMVAQKERSDDQDESELSEASESSSNSGSETASELQSNSDSESEKSEHRCDQSTPYGIPESDIDDNMQGKSVESESESESDAANSPQTTDDEYDDGDLYNFLHIATPNQESLQDSTRVNLSQEINPSPKHQTSTPMQFNSCNTSSQPQFQVQQLPPTNPIESISIHSTSQTVSENRNSQSSIEIQAQPMIETIIDSVAEQIPYDPSAEEILLNEYNELEKISAYTVDVRPWFINDFAKKRDINSMTQFALYKCMDAWCIYATDSGEKWKMHMEKHTNLLDTLSTKALISKDYQLKLTKFRECSYCGDAMQTAGRHMEVEHRRNLIQCAFCFYRTAEIDNIVLHMEIYHPKAGREILLYDVRREFQQKDEEMLRHGCEKYVTKIKCGLGGCTRKFACFNTYHTHLVVEHAIDMFECPYCFTKMACKMETIQEHLMWPHSDRHFEEFQCLYCEMGYNDVEEIRQHMSESHPSKFLFVGARWNFKTPENATDEIQIIYVGDSKDYSSYKLYTCSNSDVLNSMDPKELSPSKQLEMQKMIRIQYQNVKSEYFERLPSIAYNFTKKFVQEMFIPFELYQKSYPAHSNSSNHSECSSSSVESENYQDTSDAITSGRQDVTFPMYHSDQNCHRAGSIDSMESDNFKYSTNAESSMSSFPYTSKMPETTAIPFNQNICTTENVDDDLNTNNQMDTKHYQRMEQSYSAATSQYTATGHDATSSMHHNDQKWYRANQSIDSMMPVKSECSYKPNLSTNDDSAAAAAAAAKSPSVLSTRYICITDQMYNDLRAIDKETIDQSRLCCVTACSAFQRIENENGLHAYVEHLIRDHPCLIEEEITSVKEMLQHRLEYHKKEPFVCLQIEEFSNMLVYKIVRYQICKECLDGVDCETDWSECTHRRNESNVESKVIVTLDDSRHIDNLKEEFVSQLVFICERHDPPLALGTKQEAVRHHNEVHSMEKFQTLLQRFERYHIKNEVVEDPAHRAYLFECFQCKSLFESISAYNEHPCKVEIKNCVPQFTAHKLVACHKDETIETFTQMKNHYILMHPGEECTPIDIFNPGDCGLCNYSFASFDDLRYHYRRRHENGEPVTSELLYSMAMYRFSIDECYFTRECCPEFKTKGFDETIQRMFRRRFTCDKCTTINFDQRITYLINYQQQRKTDKEVIEWLQSFKRFSTLFTDMQIILPNGLTVALDNIDDPYFADEMRQKLNRKIMKIFILVTKQ